MANVSDVAAAVIARAGAVDQIKLQKLLYYAQGWSLAWRGEALFPETVEAWRWGPVVDAAYQDYKRHGMDEFERPESGDSEALTVEELGVVAAVVDRYGQLGQWELQQLTHEDPAWLEAWGDRGPDDRGRQAIDLDLMVRTFRRGFGSPDQPAPGDEALVERASAGDQEALEALLRA